MSGSESGRLVARVRPDVSGLDKSFDYTVPDALAAHVRVGSLVRIPLHGRRVGGWVTELGGSPPAGVALKPIAKLTGRGPSPELIELASWAARRWVGSERTFLAASSPPFAVAGLPAGRRRESRLAAPLDPVGAAALTGAGAVVRLPPVADALSLVLAAVARGDALVLTPSVAGAQLLAARLRGEGVPVALHPRDWDLAAAGGCCVIGTRSAAWAPMPRVAAMVVLDEHDEAYQEERAPTWHGRDVAVERAAREGVPCALVSPLPTLEALNGRRLLTLSRAEERAGWPIVEVVDRSREEPWNTSLLTSALLRHVRAGQRVVAVVNTTGRARVLACAACGTLARCERCDAAVEQPGDDALVCRRCGASRPVVCAACGAGRFRLLRPGVKRLREELEASAGEPVVGVSSATGPPAGPAARLVVGTEAALHQVPAADVVAFLDFDAELLAPRYRAAEQALALLARGRDWSATGPAAAACSCRPGCPTTR